MEEYLWWYAELDRFYQLLLQAAVIIGVLALLTGVSTDNAFFFTVGVLWLVGGIGAIWVASKIEAETG